MNVVLIGATGLVGGMLLSLLQDDPEVATIRVLSRRPVAFAHPKVEVVVLDFADTEAYREQFEGRDVVFCAVGTTREKVGGDLEAYRRVDFDIPVHAARFAKAAGGERFVLVSSIGADARSPSFYLRLKGEVEDAVLAAGLRSVVVVRPSLLLGDRGEVRFGERLGVVLMKPLSFLLPSPMKPIHARDVARAMLAAAKRDGSGPQVLEHREMWQLLEN